MSLINGDKQKKIDPLHPVRGLSCTISKINAYLMELQMFCILIYLTPVLRQFP